MDKFPRSLIERYLFAKSYVEFLKKELSQLQKEIGFLKSEIAEKDYQLEVITHFSEKELDLLKKQNLIKDINKQDLERQTELKEKVRKLRKENNKIKKDNLNLKECLSRVVYTLIS